MTAESLQETLRALWPGVAWSTKAGALNVVQGQPVGFLTTLTVHQEEDEYRIVVTSYRMTVGYYQGPDLRGGIRQVQQAIAGAAMTTYKACQAE